MFKVFHLREMHRELTTVDLSMIQELSDKLTCFELIFPVHTCKVLGQVSSWNVLLHTEVSLLFSFWIALVLSLHSRQGCCVFWGYQVGIPAVSLLLSSCSWESTTTDSVGQEGSSQGWVFLCHVYLTSNNASSGLVEAEWLNVIIDPGFLECFLLLAGSALLQRAGVTLLLKALCGKASTCALKPKLLLWVCLGPETRGG